MMRAVLTIIITGLTLAGVAPITEAYTFMDQSYGSPQLGLSPRSRAMGGTGSAMGSGVYSLVDNPGAMLIGRQSEVQLSGFLGRASENRFVPLFDTFDSYVVENAIAVNDNVYGSLQGGIVLDEWGERGIVLAAGIFNRYDPRYDYLDELRNSDDQIVNNKIIQTQGTIKMATIGAALPIGHLGSGFGAALNYYFGEIDYRTVTVEHPTDDNASASDDQRRKRKLDGISVTFGALGQVNERITVGIGFETGAKLKDDYTAWEDGDVITDESSNGDLNMPLRVQGGFTYRPRNEFRTTFAADVIYMPWSDLEDHLDKDQELEDTWDLRFGLEHVFYNKLPTRIGFRYAQSYAMREADQSNFTFGVGYILQNIRLDLAGEIGKRDSRQDPIRPRDEQSWSVGNGKDRVEDTLLRLTLGVDYTF